MRDDDTFPRKIEDFVDELRLRVYLREVDRRTFLKALGLGGAGVTLAACNTTLPDDFYPMPTPTPVPTPTPAPFVPASLWDVSEEHLNLYRSEFVFTRGDSQGYSFHCVNCKGNCNWELFEKDGRIVREEQAALYPQINPRIPDANPRGCNKGAQHSAALYQGNRLLYPLKRAGARGEGKWQRITWDEAIDEIASKIVDTLTSDGLDKLMIHLGTGVLSEAKRAGPLRLGSLLGAVRLFPSSAVGDMFTGSHLAYGLSVIGVSSEAWYEADYALLLAINPSVARIPDAHYLWEGKYRGGRIVTASPDYNPTARQSSLWLPIKPGADSFLMMSMVNVVLQEELYDAEFIREQTDLPFLVKTRDGKLLRQADMIAGGNDQIFYFYDEAGGRPVEAPGSMGSAEPTLRLGEVKPATSARLSAGLEGTYRVKNATGEEIEVTPVFELLKREAEKFPPEETQQYTGIHPSLVYEEARRFAGARTAIIALGYQLHKHFWGILACWGAILLAALTGHAGRRGGVDMENEWGVTGLGPLAAPKPPRFGSGFFGEWLDGNMQQSFVSHYDDDELEARLGLSKDELLEVAQEALQKRWMPYFGKPRVMVLFFDNRFVRNSAQEDTTAALLDATELYVNVNFRLDSSAQLADIVLPAAAGSKPGSTSNAS